MSGVGIASWIGIWILLFAVMCEIFFPEKLREGFQALDRTALTAEVTAVEKTNFLTGLVPRRGDVGPGIEEPGYIQDRRYFCDYTDIQRYGMKHDFCRVMQPSGGTGKDSFFACALAGTKGTSAHGYFVIDPVSGEPYTVEQGFQLSRDDYMNDIGGDGRDSYCRILKMPSGLFMPMCVRAQDKGFSAKDEIDPKPPKEIEQLLDFFAGAQVWYRFRDDLLDYTQKTTPQLAGGIYIDETPRPVITRGVTFNGIDQFIRIGDSSELSLGNKVQMRTIRSFSLWVNFNEFTNNAHIFDFGDGPGLNNTFLGILGKGDPITNLNELRPGPICQQSTVPDCPSGAQFTPEIRPQELMERSAANVDEFACPGFEVEARRLAPSSAKPLGKEGSGGSGGDKATLLFEIWDRKLRKLQIKVNRIIPLKKWTHIAITATSNDAMRPDIELWINGKLIYTLENGCLPQAKVTSNNYFGKSNWANEESQYELRDELFSGSLFDFRMYSTTLSKRKLEKIRRWGSSYLGLDEKVDASGFAL
jgi:hypothetical protein